MANRSGKQTPQNKQNGKKISKSGLLQCPISPPLRNLLPKTSLLSLFKHWPKRSKDNKKRKKSKRRERRKRRRRNSKSKKRNETMNVMKKMWKVRAYLRIWKDTPEVRTSNLDFDLDSCLLKHAFCNIFLLYPFFYALFWQKIQTLFKNPFFH